MPGPTSDPAPKGATMRRRHGTLRGLLMAWASVATLNAAAQAPAVRDGDIVFHASRSSQSQAVQLATGSRYSHMGIVFVRDGKPQVLEAVQTVRYTPLARWIARGNGGHVVIKRLRDADAVLDAAGVRRLRAAAAAFEGRPYDVRFEWSDQRIYCSELVWKLYERALGVRVGPIRRIRDFHLGNPLVIATMRERYGFAAPLDEPVVSPGDMFLSPALVTVFER